MPKNRSTRMVFGLTSVVLIAVIARNLYQQYLRHAFLEALLKGDCTKTRILLQRGMDPNTPFRDVKNSPFPDSEVVSPLAVAVAANNAPLVNMLLAQGARPDSQAFNYATHYRYHDIAMALLKKGADPNARSELAWKTLDTDMPLTDAAGSNAGSKADVALIQALLDKGANPNVKDSLSRTALMIVCSQGRYDAAQRLLIRGADPNLMEANGYTALMSAVAKPDIALVRLLIAYKADVNAHKSDQFNALMLASGYGHTEIVKLLLKAGADVHVRLKSAGPGTKGELTALRMAQQAKRLDIVHLLQEAGATE